ncbi:transcriptional activator RamA [Klebsiella michiganensis HKOPL1]|uniref:helix-turn-helix domain-containing protein n=1 Tax=Klebsiella michiganensis TaxID=1134687 RepID=UPI000444ABC0|nr:helix-turn-helix domain-containing protein [Klebsiella michiganensis]AHW89298.1 transcriptional activator RamA [Klebsiella michiganensis HKOPL1]
MAEDELVRVFLKVMKRAIFNEVVEWIESRLTINPAVDDIACGVGYSRRFVYNLFHEHAGLPVGKYIRMRRMTLAAGKLKLTQQSISSIACLLHFDSHQTFSREFKKPLALVPERIGIRPVGICRYFIRRWHRRAAAYRHLTFVFLKDSRLLDMDSTIRYL